MQIPILTTERLSLEPLSASHAQGMFDLWSEPEVCRYSGSAEDIDGNPIELPARNIDASNLILDFFLHHQALGNGFRWAVCRKFSGFVGALGFNELGPCAELAYHQHPQFWGQGLMTEACRAAISWVTRDFGASSVQAFVDPDNTASIRLLERLAFHPTGELRDGAIRYLLDGG